MYSVIADVLAGNVWGGGYIIAYFEESLSKRGELPSFFAHINDNKTSVHRAIMTPMRGQQVFIVDAALDLLIVLCAMRFAGERVHMHRVVPSALLGAAIAAWTRRMALPRNIQMMLWAPTALIMMAAAGGRASLRHPLRSALLLLSAAGLVGGTATALAGATGSRMGALLLGVPVAIALFSGAMRARRVGVSVSRVRVRCVYQGRQASFEAMVDSGNCLRDYLTHRPVIVLPETAGRARLKLDAQTPLRPILADTAGGRMMMWCFSPQEIIVFDGRNQRRVKAVMALSPGLSADAPALFPAVLYDEGDAL